jgi:DNA-binding transcriptional regulator YiaG
VEELQSNLRANDILMSYLLFISYLYYVLILYRLISGGEVRGDASCFVQVIDSEIRRTSVEEDKFMPLSQVNFIKLLGVSLTTVSLWGLGGCASMPPPQGEMAAGALAVNEAQEAEASQYAPAELRSARKKMEVAEQAMANEDYKKARRFAEQALVDAQLAEAKARAEIQRQDVEELRKSIELLRREINERTGNFE